MTQIEKQRIEEIAKKWLKIGLSCEPLDRTKAATVIRGRYFELGLVAPRIVFLESPHQCLLAKSEGGEWGAPIGEALWERFRILRDPSETAYWFKDRARKDIIREILFPLRETTLGIEDQLAHSVGPQGGDARIIGNYLEADVLCCMQAFRECCLGVGYKVDAGLSALIDETGHTCRNLHWWLPYEKVAFVSERHRTLSFDNEHKLHSETGMACSYPDGWGFYAWQGVLVSEKFQRTSYSIPRRLVPRMGWERFCSEARIDWK